MNKKPLNAGDLLRLTGIAMSANANVSDAIGVLVAVACMHAGDRADFEQTLGQMKTGLANAVDREGERHRACASGAIPEPVSPDGALAEAERILRGTAT